MGKGAGQQRGTAPCWALHAATGGPPRMQRRVLSWQALKPSNFTAWHSLASLWCVRVALGPLAWRQGCLPRQALRCGFRTVSMVPGTCYGHHTVQCCTRCRSGMMLQSGPHSPGAGASWHSAESFEHVAVTLCVITASGLQSPANVVPLLCETFHHRYMHWWYGPGIQSM